MWLHKNLKVLVPLTSLAVVVLIGLLAPVSPNGITAPPADLTTGLPKMVELYTPGCPSCVAMAPLLDRLKERCDNRSVGMDLIDISLEENVPIADNLRIVAVPTFIFLDENGTETARLVGRQTESTIRQHLTALGGTCTDQS